MKNTKGFTLAEIIVVLVILAILAAFSIPVLLGFVNDSREKMCMSNRGIVTRYYGMWIYAEKGNVHTDKNFSEYLLKFDGELCPDGGTYSWLKERNLTTCSKHGYKGVDLGLKVDTMERDIVVLLGKMQGFYDDYILRFPSEKPNIVLKLSLGDICNTATDINTVKKVNFLTAFIEDGLGMNIEDFVNKETNKTKIELQFYFENGSNKDSSVISYVRYKIGKTEYRLDKSGNLEKIS